MELKELFSRSIRKGDTVIDVLRGGSTKSETKTMNETNGLRADELALPERADDPHNMAFTDEQIALLTATDNEAAKALAFATATPEKLALLKAKE